jgi:hypothetical protein
MSVELILQRPRMNIFALAQDEITAQCHHRAHGNGQNQNQSGAQAHVSYLSVEWRLGLRPVAGRFHNIKQRSLQISRHMHEAVLCGSQTFRCPRLPHLKN